MENKYKLPWKVVYDQHWSYNDKREWGPWGGIIQPLCVVNIVDCDGHRIVETDLGIYPPEPETAEFIVKCVNEKI